MTVRAPTNGMFGSMHMWIFPCTSKLSVTPSTSQISYFPLGFQGVAC